MGIGLTNFNLLTPEQANPMIYGFNAAANGLNNLQSANQQAIKNSYLPQTLQTKITAQQLMNQIAQPKARNANAFAQADLNNTRSGTNLNNQQAANAQFQRNNPAFMNLDAAMVSGNMGGNGANQVPQGTSNQQLEQMSPQMQPGQSRQVSPQDIMSAQGNGQQLQGQGQGQPNYNFGIDVPKYSDNPVQQNLMMKRFPLQPQQQEQYKQQIDNYNTELQKANDISQKAFQVNQDLSEITGAYDRMGPMQRGKLGGNLPAVSADADLMKAGMANLIKDSTGLWQQGHITNSTIDLQSASKIMRSQNPDAVHGLAGGIAATNERANEYQQFLSKAKDMGVPFQVRDVLWNKYQRDRPLYDANANLTNHAYRNTSSDYLTPEAIANPYKYTPPNQKELQSTNFTPEAIKSYAEKHGLSQKLVREHLRQQGLI